MKSTTLNLALIVGLSAGLAGAAIAQTPDTTNPLSVTPNANAPAANPAPPANPAPVANPAAAAPNTNAPAANAAVPVGTPATSSWSPSSPLGPGHQPGHGGGKIGGHAGKGHLGHMRVGKVRGLTEHSRSHAGTSKTPEEKTRPNENR
ncbi:MAG TPA: hypothetical protein VE758_05070 [Chthoniobacterales bacterium]|nr:hypothetical protein [Chthoniobacterales bacterium]